MTSTLQAIAHLFSFDHKACDVVLQSRHITAGTYSAAKSEDDTYTSLIFVGAMIAGCGFAFARSWLRSPASPNAILNRYTTPGALCITLALFAMALDQVAAYVNACDIVLAGGSIASNDVLTLSFGRIPVAIAGIVCLFSALLMTVHGKRLTELTRKLRQPAFMRKAPWSWFTVGTDGEGAPIRVASQIVGFGGIGSILLLIAFIAA